MINNVTSVSDLDVLNTDYMFFQVTDITYLSKHITHKYIDRYKHTHIPTHIHTYRHKETKPRANIGKCLN